MSAYPASVHRPTAPVSPDGPGAQTTRPPRQRGGSDFAGLSQQIKDAGLLRRRPLYYTVRFALVITLYVTVWAILPLVGNSWWTLAVAVLAAVVFGQVALLAHDVAHRQVFRLTRASVLTGRLAGNLGIGMGYGWWQDKRSRHHANPNHEELDPDVSPRFLLWSPRQASKATGLPRLIGRAQAYLFFPLLTLEGFQLHVAAVRALADRTQKQRTTEGVLLFTHFALYLAALFTVLPPGKACVFLVVHQCLFGVYLGSIFAPNHKGMPTLTGEERPDFLRRQVLTSRNVRGGWFTDIALGGLNYQIEHHLFPSMPSPSLRRAQIIVGRYCDELGVPYLQTGLITSYVQALSSLHRAGTPIRRPQPAP